MNEMFQQGLQLMLVGMGVVFALLALLVFAVKGMSRLAQVIQPDQPEPLRPEPSRRPAEMSMKLAGYGGIGGDPQLIAAVAAAIHIHRAGARRRV